MSFLIQWWIKHPFWSFILCYSLLTSIATKIFRYAPRAKAMEMQHYDTIHSDLAIDSKDDYLYPKYASYIEQICLINLDPAMIDLETDRVKKDKLLQLVQILEAPSKQSQGLMVDYFFRANAPFSGTDSSLHLAFKRYGERLVLPQEMVVKKDVSLQGEASKIYQKDVEVAFPLTALGLYGGYVTPFSDGMDGVERYFKYALDDESLLSMPLLVTTQPRQIPKGNPMSELYFLLRNRDLEGKERAVLVYQAGDIISGKLPLDALTELVKHKIVIVGHIEGYKTKYGTSLDVFDTPVDKNMSGSLVLANAWINLKGDINFNTGGTFLIFLFNLMFGVAIKLKLPIIRSATTRSLLKTAVKFVFSLLFFYLLSLKFWEWWHIKLSLGVSLVVFQYQDLFWTFWKEITENFARKRNLIHLFPSEHISEKPPG